MLWELLLEDSVYLKGKGYLEAWAPLQQAWSQLP